MAEVDAIYVGLDSPDPAAERIGTLAALVDYRDGTNLTGLNPKGEKLIRHIGITGHFSSPVMMECLQRDEQDVIDAMLIAINANDRRYLNHQHNTLSLACGFFRIFLQILKCISEPRSLVQAVVSDF